MSESLTLRWGTLKAWSLTEGSPAFEAVQNYHDAGPVSASVMTQHDTDDQKQHLCDAIDALDSDTVYLDWEGADVSKADAKQYVNEYGQETAS